MLQLEITKLINPQVIVHQLPSQEAEFPLNDVADEMAKLGTLSSIGSKISDDCLPYFLPRYYSTLMRDSANPLYWTEPWLEKLSDPQIGIPAPEMVWTASKARVWKALRSSRTHLE